MITHDVKAGGGKSTQDSLVLPAVIGIVIVTPAAKYVIHRYQVTIDIGLVADIPIVHAKFVRFMTLYKLAHEIGEGGKLSLPNRSAGGGEDRRPAGGIGDRDQRTDARVF